MRSIGAGSRFLRALPEPDFRKAFSHPDWGIVSIEEALGMYAWHCRHHTAHIRIGAGKWHSTW